FTVGIAGLTCLLFGLAPAISASAADPGAALKVGARGLIGGRRRFLVRRGLVVVQVALSAVLVIAALLFTQSLRNLLQVDVGFDQQGLIIASIDMTAMALSPGRRLAVKQQIVDELRRQPG